jgi:hypothetical protein
MSAAMQKHIDRLDGRVNALSLAILAIIDAMPAEMKVKTWRHVDLALEGGKTGLLNTDTSEAELDGFDLQATVYREVR